MLEAFKANPMLGSPMFVFTDASAKDGSPENIEKLKTVASQYDCAINFFTNQLGCGDGKLLFFFSGCFQFPWYSNLLSNGRITALAILRAEANRGLGNTMEHKLPFRRKFDLL